MTFQTVDFKGSFLLSSPLDRVSFLYQFCYVPLSVSSSVFILTPYDVNFDSLFGIYMFDNKHGVNFDTPVFAVNVFMAKK